MFRYRAAPRFSVFDDTLGYLAEWRQHSAEQMVRIIIAVLAFQQFRTICLHPASSAYAARYDIARLGRAHPAGLYPPWSTLRRLSRTARSRTVTGDHTLSPDVLSINEAARLLEAAAGMKYKAVLGVAYGVGLRVSEVAHLKVDDIDSTRMLIRVEQGKGRKDRNAML